MDPVKVAFISNFNNYYRAPVFDALSECENFNLDFFFFSKGGEKYWMREHGVEQVKSQHIYLKGFEVLDTRITPSIFWHLTKKNYAVYVKCINGRFALPAAYLVCRLRRKPFILWTEVWMNHRTWGHRLGAFIVRHIYRNADAIVAGGKHVKGFLVEEGANPARIIIARQAVNNQFYGRQVSYSEKIRIRRDLGLKANTPIILFVGRFTEVKGLPYLLRAFAKLIETSRDADAVLWMIGTGEERESLEQLALKLGIAERVIWAGYIRPERTVASYAASTVMVLPSVELDYIKETWGLVVNEAFNQGLPVVATDAVGAAAGGLVEDGKTGFVVPQKDADALGTAIATLLADAALRDRMSYACREAVGPFTQKGMAEDIASAIRLATISPP